MVMKQINKVRKKLGQGKLVTGSAIYSASPNMVEAAAYSGIDFVRIDTEHTWRRDDSMDHMIRAAYIADAVPIVRVDRHDPYLLRKALEIGAGGLIIPQVETAEEAREVVKAAKFPPLGTRGSGPMSQSGEWGRRRSDEWLHWSNTQPLVGIMIESLVSMKEAREMMQVEGIDFVVFGPSDFRVGLDAKYSEADKDKIIKDALKETIAVTREAGKHVMYSFAPHDNKELQEGVEMGITMLDLSHDVVIVRTHLNNRIAFLNEEYAMKMHSLIYQKLMEDSHMPKSILNMICSAAVLTLVGMHGAAAQVPDAAGIEAAAKKEGKLVIYTSSTTPEMNALSAEFAKKFPEINIEFVRQTSGVVFNRYLGEVESGVSQVDLLYTASTALYEEKPDLFLELNNSNVPNLARSRSVVARNSASAITAVTPHMITYSTKTVSEDDIKNHLKEWRKLADPRWKGRIGLVDPRASVNAASFINTLRTAYGDEWLKDLAKNDLKIFESGTTAAQQAVAGALQLVIPTNFSQSAALRNQNAPVAVYQPEGPAHAQAQSLGVAKKANNPNAALTFINWQLSDDGQAAICVINQVPVTDFKGEKCGKMLAGIVLSNDLLPPDEKQKIFGLLGLPK